MVLHAMHHVNLRHARTSYTTILSSSGLSAQLATSCHLGEDSPTGMMRHVPHLRPGTRYHDTLHLPEKLLFSSGSFLSTQTIQYTVTVQHLYCIHHDSLLESLLPSAALARCGAPKLNHHEFFFFSLSCVPMHACVIVIMQGRYR